MPDVLGIDLLEGVFVLHAPEGFLERFATHNLSGFEDRFISTDEKEWAFVAEVGLVILFGDVFVLWLRVAPPLYWQATSIVLLVEY